MSYLRHFAYPTRSLLGRNAAASANEPSGAGPRAVSTRGAKLDTKAARLAGVSKAPVAPKTGLTKPLRGAGGGVEGVVLS